MRFNVRVKALTTLCVGGGAPEPGIDIAFAKRITPDGEQEYYIPGSSFKGALRSAACRVAKAYGFSFCGKIDPGELEKVHRNGEACHVCRLFGYPSRYAGRGWSRLFVSDLEPAAEFKPFIMTRVRIDDRSLRAVEGGLFNLEYIPPGVEFHGEVWLRDWDEDLLALLILSLAELRLDRFGRASIIDLRVEEDEELEKELRGTRWMELLIDLREWMWSEVL